MRFYELLQTINFASVWEHLQEYYGFEMSLFDNYQKAFHDLCNAVPAEMGKEMLLVVAMVHDEFEDNNYVYDVYGVYPENPIRYALELTPWEEWLSFRVLQKSLALYGSVVFVAHALNELTFFGFSIEDARERLGKEVNVLNERIEEVENGKANYISAEEVFKELGLVDERTQEEKCREKRRLRSVIEANNCIYASLLDESD